jgi:hypothetical protein
MPLSKSSRSSKSSRPSLLSLPSVHSLLSNSSHERDLKSPGGSSLARAGSVETVGTDEPGAEKLERRKSRLHVLTSFFANPSSRGSTSTEPAEPVPSLRPKTATEALPPTHLRAEPIPRRPIASTGELATRPASSNGSPHSSNPYDSVSTIDNSPGGAGGLGVQTPVTQVSDYDFNFGVERTESPAAADIGAETHPGFDMPQVIQKQPRAVSADSAPPLPPKDPLPRDLPPAPASPAAPKSRGSARSSSAHQSSPDSRDGPSKLQSTRRSAAAPRMRSSSAQPSTHREILLDGAQAASTDAATYPRPMSKQSNDGGDSRGRLRRSWLPGRPSSGSKDLKKMSPSKAWILSADNQADYNTAFLANNEKVLACWTPPVGQIRC